MTEPSLALSPEQRKLLQAALVSNQPTTAKSVQTQSPGDFSFTPSMSDKTAPGSGHLDFSDDSPYLDFGLDGDFDETFTFDQQGQMIGDLPEDSSPNDLHEKRKSIDGRDDEDDEGGGKRREGDDKTAKKPGRKPLTSEPTTKRKAQNRAAQRAFRERKEKHLKDLETKVEELEKSSESANHENGLLRARVEKLTIELREYRKRLSWMTNGTGRQQSFAPSSQSSIGGGSDFQFEFPKFGDLPTANYSSASNKNTTANTPASNANISNRGAARSSSNQSYSASPASTTAARQQSFGSVGNSPMNNNTYTASPQSQSYTTNDSLNRVDSLSGLFSPSLLETTRNNSLSYFPDNSGFRNNNNGRSSFDHIAPVPGLTTSGTNTDSPGSSADSQQHISSMGTSPEPLFNSPKHKQDFGLNVVSENSQLNIFGTSNFNMDSSSNGFDWLAQQNGGSFDPVLFGDYREAQDNILSQDFGSFFNDAYPLPELGSPSHNYGELPASAAPGVGQTDLMKRVDAAKEGEEMVPAEKSKMLTCNKIWDRLQSMEKFRNGEIDIDNLCSELRAKAKCSEGGAVVDEKHVNKLLGGL